ncbi:hypothetical protein Tco_0500568 [Tanacetum coccineum]
MSRADVEGGELPSAGSGHVMVPGRLGGLGESGENSKRLWVSAAMLRPRRKGFYGKWQLFRGGLIRGLYSWDGWRAMGLQAVYKERRVFAGGSWGEMEKKPRERVMGWLISFLFLSYIAQAAMGSEYASRNMVFARGFPILQRFLPMSLRDPQHTLGSELIIGWERVTTGWSCPHGGVGSGGHMVGRENEVTHRALRELPVNRRAGCHEICVGGKLLRGLSSRLLR